MRIMFGCTGKKRKYRKIIVGIGSHIHVEVVTEKITFPVRVPSPVTVRLRIMASTVAGRAAFILTIADPLFPLLCGSTDRGAISGKGQMVGIDQSLADRKIQELLLIETENKKKRIFRFQLPAFQKRKKFGSNAGRVTGSFIAFLFPLGRFHFRETVFR